MTLFCTDPSRLLSETRKKCRSVIYFSATLLPKEFYENMLCGKYDENRRFIRLPSPFPRENLGLYAVTSVSTRYDSRYTSVAIGTDAETYRCVYDKDGKLIYDTLNPDPELRKIPIHQAVIIAGLKYNPEKKQWDGGKIHNPGNRLEKANCTVDFVDDGKYVRVFGNLMGIGKSVYWKVVKE